MIQNQNPFELVYSGLWDLLLAHPRLKIEIAERNRVRFDIRDDRDPIKEAVQDADLPEISLLAQTLSANVHETSNTSRITRTYIVLIATGDLRYAYRLAMVEWCVWCAMLGWQTRLTNLKWHNESFVKRLGVTSGSSGIADPSLNRNIKGWSAVWRCEVEMHFRTELLTQELC